MLRRISIRRAELLQPVAAEALAQGASSSASEPDQLADGAQAPGQSGPARGRRVTWKRALLAAAALFVVGAGGAYSQKDQIAPQAADFSRKVIGDENTARLEGWAFQIEDRAHKVKYRLLGGEENPFETKELQVQFVPQSAARELTYFVGTGRDGGQTLTAEALGPLPMQFPVTQVIFSDPQPGEGTWSTTGLPRNTAGETLMAKTFIRPDKSRPYASVGVLLVDKRRILLKMVGGTLEPGGDRGVKGPGVIPKDDYKSLLVAFNGGFKGPHGSYGMVANGKEYMKMRNGLATLCVSKDGTLKMGEYGRDFTWEENFEACRQNVILLVDGGQVSRRTTEGNDTWGYVNVNSSEFITWRSAVGITKDGNLLIGAGNSLSADTLAKAMYSAGAYMAMQLDINGPYISTALFYPQPDGSVRADKFMDSMSPSAANFLGTRERDFFYLTLDESRYR
ncbi:phosphodiester glycosidase family protein [Candidatus Amarobacter glycogenicus]|uniref:phosphodiester glycosidase family protein n=1 Tax=Candidatus Amarobacter glycogenicus TaxID=3140699 RepID=UPI0031376548|nr:phosphodiester glycosidase family protein [Dehalococcoidia bacterium]